MKKLCLPLYEISSNLVNVANCGFGNWSEISDIYHFVLPDLTAQFILQCGAR